jgi:hypothetical protein
MKRYAIVKDEKVFAGTSPTGRLIWNSLDQYEAIEAVLFATTSFGEIVGMPDDVEIVEVNGL